MNDADETRFSIRESDLHAHLQARMEQRGITFSELQQTLASGWEATDCRPGTAGRVFVFSYEAEWEGRFYNEKEVTVYFKVKDNQIILLTAKSRYGQGFPRGETTHED
ncbi:MAG: DUF4258 domain-containing protein [Chloroflexi bacterium]|nr:MAG: DUF4258 domain-containing protein [Chloroflexota bacterium]